MRVTTRGSIRTAIIGAALLAVACGGASSLDTDSVAVSLSESLSASLGGQVDVTCPEDVPAEKGHTFTCTATAGDESFDVVVTETSDEGDVTARRAELDMDAIEAQISAPLEQLGNLPIEVTCPDDVEVGKGKTFECVASSERGELTMIVTQTDDFGNITFEPADAEE